MSGAGESETPSISTARKRAPADREIRRRVERLDDALDQRGIVGREDAERVADRVVDAVPAGRSRCARCLLGARALSRVRARNVPVAGLSRVGRWTGRSAASGVASGFRAGAALAELLVERLEHAGGFLAARHAQVQPLLFLVTMRFE
jgi:hypothetical protein